MGRSRERFAWERWGDRLFPIVVASNGRLDPGRSWRRIWHRQRMGNHRERPRIGVSRPAIVKGHSLQGGFLQHLHVSGRRRPRWRDEEELEHA